MNNMQPLSDRKRRVDWIDLFNAHVEPSRQRFDRGARGIFIEHHAAAHQFSRQPAEHQIGIRNRRQITAAAVTRRARHGARTVGPDDQQAVGGK